MSAPGISDGRVRRIVGPTILLHSGTYFDFEAPASSAFSIEDVAHALSLTCRFAGQCDRFYSVAEHCVHVSREIAPADALAGLLHDAAEAFIGDVTRPLKQMLPEYRVIEARVEKAVFERFGLKTPLPQSVKDTDMAMLLTEQRQLMRNRDVWPCTSGKEAFAITLPCWEPQRAKAQFLARYYEITGSTQQDRDAARVDFRDLIDAFAYGVRNSLKLSVAIGEAFDAEDLAQLRKTRDWLDERIAKVEAAQ